MASSAAALAPVWMDGVQVNAAQMRREILGGIYDQAGIVRGLAVSALPTPAMKVRLPVGLAVVDDGQSGYYPLANPTQVDLDVAPSSATQPRIDSLIAQVIDNGNNTSTYLYRVVTGSPAGTPTPPALPYVDAPGSLTERIANIWVQANAEVNGYVRTQDVTVVAPMAIERVRPSSSDMTNLPSFGSTNAWVDFTSAQWPPVTVVVPSSGQVKVTVSGGDMANSNSTTSTLRLSYRISGSNTVSADPLDSKSALASGQPTFSLSRTTLIKGLTPGGSITVTPQWRISSGSASTVSLTAGQLLVEPVA